MSMKTKGTQAWYVLDGHLILFGCPKGISGLGGAKSQIDETCLDSEEMQFGPGMANPGAITITADLDWQKQSHRDMEDMFEDDLVTTWVIGYSDGAKDIVPTINSAGVITWPAGRSFTEFQGYVADLGEDFAINANVAGNISVQRTGPRIRHLKALA